MRWIYQKVTADITSFYNKLMLSFMQAKIIIKFKQGKAK